MYHAVHTADVHEDTVGGHGLHDAGVVLADLDVGPDLSLLGGALLGLDGADGAHDAAAGAVDLGDTEVDLLLDEAGEVSAPGQAALGGGDEDPDALDGHHETALVFLGDGTLEDGLLLDGLLDVLPDLHGVQTLLGELGVAFHVVDADDVGLDLVAHVDNVLGLDGGIVAQLAELDVGGLLGAHIHLHLSRGDGGDDTGDLLSCI